MKIINKTILWDYLLRLKFKYMSLMWERENKHNFTRKNNNFNHKIVSVGKYSYGPLEVITYGKSKKLIIGSFVSIGPDVKFLLEVEHSINRVSTYPYKARLFEEDESMGKGNIVIEDDVWIGQGVTILSGVRISQGAVVASGAVVVSDVPPYSVVGGVPAKVIKYRFSESLVDYMRTLDYEKLDDSLIKDHIKELYIPLDNMSLGEVKELLDWFPKKKNN